MIGRLGTILKWIILLPLLLVALLLAVANTQSVSVHLNPFDSADPALTAEIALYQVVFLVFVAGALVGGLVVWISQHKYRRQARASGHDAALWQARAERNERRDAAVKGATATALLTRPEN